VRRGGPSCDVGGQRIVWECCSCSVLACCGLSIGPENLLPSASYTLPCVISYSMCLLDALDVGSSASPNRTEDSPSVNLKSWSRSH